MKRSRYKKNGWKRSLLAVLAAVIFVFNGMTALGAGMTSMTSMTSLASSTSLASMTSLASSTSLESSTVTGNGDFIIWCRNSTMIERWVTDIYAAGQSGILDEIAFVEFYDYYDYLAALEAILPYPEEALYPDLIVLEPDYGARFQKEEFLLSAGDLGITETDMENMFPYTVVNGMDAQGEVRMFYCTAAPGAFQVRADLAQEYLGTTNPMILHDLYFSDWKKMMAAARKVYIESGGMVALLPGYMELYGGLAMPEQGFAWVNRNGLPADASQIARMMRLSQGFEEYTFGAVQWGIEWLDAMDGDGIQTPVAIAYAGAPWFTAYSLMDAWRDNTVIVEGPVDFQWGGTGIAATAGCSDVDMAADIIRTLCCDADAMMEIVAMGEFANNREALQQADALGYGKCDYLFGQNKNLIQAYLPIAEDTAGNVLTPYDVEIKDMYSSFLMQYISQGGGKEESLELAEELREALEEMIASH